MNNLLNHTKQFELQPLVTTGVYAVGFDVFIFSPRPQHRIG
ncbi:MAG TPA: hypothetical protein PKE30_21625 [Niabella sp.]|nr:hypothetical protein [Niabella sp.]